MHDGHEAAVRARVDLVEGVELTVFGQSRGESADRLAVALDYETHQSTALGAGHHGGAKSANAGLDVGVSLHRHHDLSGILPASIMAFLTCFQMCISR